MLFVVNRAVERRREGLGTRARREARRRGFDAVVVDSRPEQGDWSAGVALLTSTIEQQRARLVVAVGGDGTAGACAEAAAPLGVPLGIVPRGAANLMAHALGLPFRFDHALEVALTGAERVVDLASINGRIFVAMAGLGLDAAVVGHTSTPIKRRLGWVGYGLVGLTRLHAPPAAFEIRLDGGDPLLRRARTVVVGNLGLLPGGFALLPEARLDDGALDVGLLAPDGALGWVELAGHLLAARLHAESPEAALRVHRLGADHPLVEHHRAKRVEIVADRSLPGEADGEVLAPASSLTAEVVPSALRVRVPRPAAPRLGGGSA